MDTTPRQTEKNERQKAVEAALTKWGFESLWANGKGGGFWVKGEGYKSLEECAKLINAKIKKFISDEKDRLGELMLGAMAEAQKAQNTSYFEKAVTVYQDANAKLGELNALPVPYFILPPAEFKPLPNPTSNPTE